MTNHVRSSIYIFSLPRYPCDDLCRVWFLDDISETLWLHFVWNKPVCVRPRYTVVFPCPRNSVGYTGPWSLEIPSRYSAVSSPMLNQRLSTKSLEYDNPS